MFRLLATDIDGTLLGHDGRLPEANREGLRRLHASGVAVVFASGRADVSIRSIAARILEPDDRDYLIAFNGARVVTADTRRRVREHNLPPATIGAVMAHARGVGLYVQAYSQDEFLVEFENRDTEFYAADTDMAYRVVDAFEAELPQGSPKLLAIGEHEDLDRHLRDLRRLAEDIGEPGRPAFSVAFSKPRYLEIVAPGIDKGTALRELAEQLSIPIEETIALGDSGNDVAMLAAAGTGVAVGDARKEAKDAAAVVLETVADEGILPEVIRRFFGG